ncbi:MAG: flavin reductase family protein [Gemmataceae bacterium]|nr:flavin reductase family protein [Gemmata sp.]MDW8196861.1 flavin reductase family protein [Gemmataceae bacterium]
MPPTTLTEHTPESLAAALGRIPSGLFILTARRGDAETGMLASWVQQCSFDPPLISVAVNNQRGLLDWLVTESPFVVHIIPEGGKALVAHFGKGFAPDEPAFSGLEVQRLPQSPPILPAAHAYLLCRVEKRIAAGDHTLIIGRVESGAILQEGQPTVHIRKNGLRY